MSQQNVLHPRASSEYRWHLVFFPIPAFKGFDKLFISQNPFFLATDGDLTLSPHFLLAVDWGNALLG
ncbi:MAG: hypothetical protein ACI965_000931 [Paraglaciecola sp.]|jgi:hypothetical protein